MANTSCSIDLEPRTLNPVQLTQAKVLAAEVVQKLEPNEASAVFVEGVRHPIKEMEYIEENRSQVENLSDSTNKVEAVADEKACHCQCSYSTEIPLHVSLKEPLSAPF